MFFSRLSLLIALGASGLMPLAMAETIDVTHAGKIVSVEKNADILPLSIGDGVSTVGESEVLDFMGTSLKKSAGLILDNRNPGSFAAMTIPGSVNIPGFILDKGLENSHVINIIKLLGATKTGSGWNFDNARKLLLFGEGPLVKDSYNSVRKLLEMGYPGEKIFWYRGGLSAWKNTRLTVVSKNGVVKAAAPVSSAAEGSAADDAVASTGAAGTGPVENAAPALPELVVVGANESLSDVAERVYGDQGRFFDLFNANKDRIKDINVVHEGQELVVPRP